MILIKKDFSLYIEECLLENDEGIIDNVLRACEKYNIDPEMIEPLINRSIKEKLEVAYTKLHYLNDKRLYVIL